MTVEQSKIVTITIFIVVCTVHCFEGFPRHPRVNALLLRSLPPKDLYGYSGQIESELAIQIDSLDF